jgi:trimethylamine monooxygenase
MQVAIIGCGPSGMFFLHALAHRRKRLEAEGDTAALALLPDVTCFERSSAPGGVWKSDRVEDKDGDDNTLEKSTSMYEALWMNGPKECLEFFDYTFDEHFGCAMPMYLPRKLFLEYMLARCTRDNPTFFDDVRFNTSVESVTYNEVEGKFVLQTLNRMSGLPECTLFDKCIWAAGLNGKPKIPKSISETLSSGGFKGRVIHSSEVGPIFDQCARGKKILMIGDSFSAEDLALQAIKLGAETVDICSRSGEGIACETGSWPQDRVDIHECYLPTEVTKDGSGVVLSNGKEEVTLEDIETVIFCTGYLPNMDMLDESLRPHFEGPYIFTDYDLPKDWKMSKNPLTREFGHIAIGKILASIGIVRGGEFLLFCHRESIA